MTKSEIETLAEDVMDLLLDREHPSFQTLRDQYRSATTDVSVTKSGFFVDFGVPDGADRLPTEADFQFGDVEAELEELDYGMTFVLFVEDGRLSLLEGATYEEPLPESISNLSLSYIGDGGKRDGEELIPR